MTGARARQREEHTQNIKAVARRHLGEYGASGLSLRAVAREVGLVSSAVYRYFPSRDELLTALIVDAFNSVADATALAEDNVRSAGFEQRWRFLTAGFRAWAHGHPHEYALIFGTPVPGYQAPQDTVDPGIRVPLQMLALVAEAQAAGRTPAVTQRPALPVPPQLRTDLTVLRETTGAEIGDMLLARAVLAWAELVGLVSFELFGQLKGAFSDEDLHFDYQMRGIGAELGL